MADPTGESKSEALRLNFDHRLLLQCRGSLITSDGGLLAYRELDDVLGLTTSGGERLAETCTGKNRRHLLVGLLRQSGFGRLGGCAMIGRCVGWSATERSAAPPLRPARWAGSRRNGYVGLRTLPRSPIC